jgi:hypothetical protein
MFTPPPFIPSASTAPTVSHSDSVSSEADQGTYSWSNVSIGAVSGDSIVATVHLNQTQFNAASNFVVVVGGVTLDLVVTASAASTTTCAMYRGTATETIETGSVSVDVGGGNTGTRIEVDVFVMKGLTSTTPVDTFGNNAFSSGSTFTDTLTLGNPGVIITASQCTSATDRGHSFTGDGPLEEKYEVHLESSLNAAGGCLAFATGGNKTINSVWDGTGSSARVVMVAWE